MHIRRFILCIFLLLMFIPCSIKAKEYCRFVTDNGKKIGSEVMCGTEPFYIIENKDNKLKLLAKYNLNAGDKIDYFPITENQPVYDGTGNSGQAAEACMNIATGKGYHPYYVYPMLEERVEQNQEVLTGCRVYEIINEGVVHQDARAVGTKLNGEGKSILPLYGITYMNPEWGYDATINNIVHENVYDSKGDLVLTNSSFETYLNNYKSELERQKISVEKVSFITLNQTLEFLKNISGKDVFVELNYPEWSEEITKEDYITGKMDITKYVSNDYKWIYDRSYWLGSGFKTEGGRSDFNDYYISNEGMLCAIGRGECGYLPYPIGNGVRPLVTLTVDNVLFIIRTKTDGNGTIEVVESAYGGDTISFKTVSKRGLKLTGLVVVADSGEKVEFSEEDIKHDGDGIYSISTNKFTMPYDNVTIEAKWGIVVSVPDTLKNLSLGSKILIIVVILSLIIEINIYRKKNSKI